MSNKTNASDQSNTDMSPKPVKISRGKKPSKPKQGPKKSPEEKDLDDEVKDVNR